MYCDYTGLAEYANILSKNFSSVTRAISNMEIAIDSIVTAFNWNTESKDYFLSFYKILQDNFNLIDDRLSNIKQYIDIVISNYQAVDNVKKTSFGG